MELDLTQQEPIPYKNTIAILNEYILQNIDLLNKFGHFNENKLYEMEVILDETESKVLLLEKKLDSLPSEVYNGLVIDQPAVQNQQAQQQQNNQTLQHQHSDLPDFQQRELEIPLNEPQQTQVQVPEQPQQQEEQQQPQQQQEEQQENVEQKNEDDGMDPELQEKLQKYIKLLSYGVMPVQLKMRMQQEGVDPNLLDIYLSKQGQ